MPGLRGGAEWSGACVDMATGIMYVGINDIPNIVQRVEKKQNNPDKLFNLPLAKAGFIFIIQIAAFVMVQIKKVIALFHLF